MENVLNLGRMARRIGVHQAWLKDAADKGIVPHLKAGSRYLFNPTAVEKVILKKASQPCRVGGAK